MEGCLQGREAGQIVRAAFTHGAGQALELRIPDQAVADAAPLRPFHDLALYQQSCHQPQSSDGRA